MIAAFATLLLATLAAADCNADNCLRALRNPGRLNSAQMLCSVLHSTQNATIPSYAVDACQDNQNGVMSVRIASACACIATPAATTTANSSTTAVPTSTVAPTLTDACALVSSSSSAQKVLAPTATPSVSAQLAHDCLVSVPLNKTAAIALVDSMGPYIEWQSDTAWKKDPPANYFYPPHDIFGYLASVMTNLQADKYANEYEFQADLYQVFARAHDGHFVFYPDALTGAFEFGRRRSLVSISKDGASLPEIKLYEDVTLNPKTASVVTLINGVDAATYVGNYSYQASFNQDADAAYNTMFYEKAFTAGGTGNGYFSSGGRIRYIYPGPNTTFTFANGSVLTTENYAKVKGNFAGVINGPSFFTRFCSGALRDALLPADQAAEEDFVPTIIAPGYPPSVVTTNDSIVSGYYLDGEGYNDVAVISLLSFESESPLEFQQVAQAFFADAIRDGKKKLVIDISANGGGYILQGYDLFRQLFPSIVQDGNSRWRTSDTLLAISEIYSAASAGVNPATATDAQIQKYEDFFNYRYDLNTSNLPFPDFASKFYGPGHKGDNFTNLMRWDLNDPLTTSNESYGLGTDITGYRSRANFTQPFKAENIILLEDGYCASTCTLFAEFMRLQGGVKAVAMGGRPKTGAIQGVGGIKGAQILSWSSIYSSAQTALRGNVTAAQKAALNRLSPLPARRASSTGVNVRDNILPANIKDGLPAQFVREEADCRLYYTEPMITDVTALWKAAADAAFNGKECAYGGIGKRRVDAGEEEVVNRKPVVRRGTKRVHVVERNTGARKTKEWKDRHELKVIA